MKDRHKGDKATVQGDEATVQGEGTEDIGVLGRVGRRYEGLIKAAAQGYRCRPYYA